MDEYVTSLVNITRNQLHVGSNYLHKKCQNKSFKILSLLEIRSTHWHINALVSPPHVYHSYSLWKIHEEILGFIDKYISFLAVTFIKSSFLINKLTIFLIQFHKIEFFNKIASYRNEINISYSAINPINPAEIHLADHRKSEIYLCMGFSIQRFPLRLFENIAAL